MVKFQAIPYGETLSYFQIAGIHGLPHVPWDPWPYKGYHPMYCEHNTIKFGTWHRPYMVLVEQRIYELMLSDVIPAYDQATQIILKKEAAKFRLPYWDWAVKKTRQGPQGQQVKIYDLPLIVQKEKVQITLPNGSSSEIANPFWCFSVRAPGSNNNVPPMGEYGITPVPEDPDPNKAIPADRAFATSRCPPDPYGSNINMQTFVNGIQNNGEAAKNLQAANWYQPGTQAYTIGEAVYRLFSKEYFSVYKTFVTTAYTPKTREYMSLEGVHNNIHNWTGGSYGHMSSVPIAAFDPIFWFHHSNIDRLVAIWQGLYPSKWWTSADVNNVQSLLPTAPLEPFHSNTERVIYNSDAVRNHIPLGYTYPELQRWNYNSDEAYIISIRTAVHNLYGDHQNAAVIQAVATYGDYIVNIKYERFALEGNPFTVVILLNEKVVGSVYNFSAKSYVGDGHGCQNCARQQQANEEATGQVAITSALVAHYLDDDNDALTEFDTEAISKYLREKLDWKVVRPNREEIPLANIPSLKVSVATGRRSVSKVPDQILETWLPEILPAGGITELRGITEKKLLNSRAEWGDMYNDVETIHIEGYRVALHGWEDFEVLPDVTDGRPGGLNRNEIGG